MTLPVQRASLTVSPNWPFQLSGARWARLWQAIVALDPALTTYQTEAEAQQLLLALLYQALTEGPGAALPASAPAPDLVAATAVRWQARGLLGRLSAVLHVQLLEAPTSP